MTVLLRVCELPHGGAAWSEATVAECVVAAIERGNMQKLIKSVGVSSAAVAFAAGSALVAPAAGAQSSLPGGSLGGEQCGEQVVTPENLATSGWAAPDDETAAEIAAVDGASEEVGAAALTFPEDSDEAPGTSLYKTGNEMMLSELVGDDGNTVPLSYDYTSSGQAPALQLRLNGASLADSEEDSAGYDDGFATIVWSPADGTAGEWGAAEPEDSDQFWVTRALDAGDEGDIDRGERMTLEEVVDLNPNATITAYGVQQTRDNDATNVAIDNFTLGCETTNFELESDEGFLGSLTDVFGNMTGSLSS